MSGAVGELFSGLATRHVVHKLRSELELPSRSWAEIEELVQRADADGDATWTVAELEVLVLSVVGDSVEESVWHVTRCEDASHGESRGVRVTARCFERPDLYLKTLENHGREHSGIFWLYFRGQICARYRDVYIV